MESYRSSRLLCSFFALALAGSAAAAPAPPAAADGFNQAMAAFTAKNYVQAAQLFRGIAAQGNPSGELMLGVLYAQGQGVPKDLNQARQWYQLALAKADLISAGVGATAAFLRERLQEARQFLAQDQAQAPGSPPAVSSIYTGDQYRDPFAPLSGGRSGLSTKKFSLSEFNIHHLNLRGLMSGGETTYALFVDSVYGVSFILRGRNLYDSKGKLVPGVWGKIDARRKTVDLITRDKDVQPFRLGEPAKE